MSTVRSAEELMRYISEMNNENSVCQFFIPGKGKFTLVFQEEDQQRSIADDIEANPDLKKMINEARRQYQEGLGVSTSELLKSLTPRDFE